MSAHVKYATETRTLSLDRHKTNNADKTWLTNNASGTHVDVDC